MLGVNISYWLVILLRMIHLKLVVILLMSCNKCLLRYLLLNRIISTNTLKYKEVLHIIT